MRKKVFGKNINATKDDVGKNIQAEPKEEERTYLKTGKYIFKDSEKMELSRDLANKQIDKRLVEDEKKSAMSQYKDRLDRFDSDINRLSRNIINGYELREFECHMVKDFDAHIKKFIDIHTKIAVAEEPLDPSDYQGELTFASKKKK